MTTICSHCGLDLTEAEESDNRYVVCPHCNWFVPKGSQSYQGRIKKTRRKRARISNPSNIRYTDERRCKMANGKPKKSNGKPKVQRTLTCSRCGAVKKAGKKRVEKWKGKKYFCRECRKEIKEEKKKKK